MFIFFQHGQNFRWNAIYSTSVEFLWDAGEPANAELYEVIVSSIDLDKSRCPSTTSKGVTSPVSISNSEITIFDFLKKR